MQADSGALLNDDARANANAGADTPAVPDALTDAVTQARLAMLGMLVAGLAHELNTPLGALNSNHDVLRRALGKLQGILADEVVTADELDEVRRVVRAIDGVLRVNDMAVERMSELVRNLRSFGRLDRAGMDHVDLHEGLDSTLAILDYEMRPLVVRKEYGELPAVECQAHQINQVFMNLLLNARQATPPDGSITVRTRAHEGRVIVSVIDTGSGMDAGRVAHIFEPGFTTKGARVGMGLGLPISLQIVQQHGGRIDVQSSTGNGTTFTVTLPVRQATITTVQGGKT